VKPSLRLAAAIGQQRASINSRVVAAIVASAVGCVTPAMRVSGVQVVPSRILALPADGIVWHMDAAREGPMWGEKTATAIANVDDAVRYRLSLFGGRSVEPETFRTWAWAASFQQWIDRTMSEIMSERLGQPPVRHASVAEWRYGSSLASWREYLGADYLLVSRFFDGRNSPDGRITVPVRHAMTCMVRVEDGVVVWCNLIRYHTRIDRPKGAQAVVNALLFDLLGALPGMVPPVRGATAAAPAVTAPSEEE
jgi:hypothetical protein